MQTWGLMQTLLLPPAELKLGEALGLGQDIEDWRQSSWGQLGSPNPIPGVQWEPIAGQCAWQKPLKAIFSPAGRQDKGVW